MVSLMLVARATGRQVGIYTCTIRYAYRYKHVVYIHVCVLIQAMTAESYRSMHELDYNAT